MRIIIIIIIIKNTILNREKGKPTLKKRMSEKRLRARDEFIIQTDKCMTYILVYKQYIYIYINIVYIYIYFLCWCG